MSLIRKPKHPIRTREAAQILGVCSKSVQNLARAGHFKMFRVGDTLKSPLMVYREDIEHYLALVSEMGPR